MKRLRNAVLLIVFSNFLLINGLAISPKLDFPEKSGGVVEVKRELKGGKIKGLRVTVDTSELKESKSSDSDSSASSDSSSERKKTVGVRTDVTFEITSGESTNDTITVDDKEIGKDDDNASIPVVPVFKGTPDRGGSKAIDSSDNEILSVLPLENPSNPPRVPIYQSPRPISHQHDGYMNRYGGNNGGETLDDGWKLFPQYEIWTTERNNHNDLHSHRRFNQQPPAIYHPHSSGGQFDYPKRPPSGFFPYQVDHNNRQTPSYRPCDCKEYPGPHTVGVQPLQPLRPDEFKHTNKIDDKLERPFSKTNKK